MKRRQIISGLLSMALTAALFLHPNTAFATQIPTEPMTAPTETTVPEPVQTEPVTPPVTEPEGTVPETTTATEPEGTVPETTTATEPEGTVPETTTAAEPEGTVPETTAATEPEETIPETTAVTEPEETVPETLPDMTLTGAPAMFSLRMPANILTVAEAKALSSGTENVSTQGTVVFAMGTQAVLQDDSGGIRLSFSQEPGLSLGDILVVTGKRSGGLSVETHSVMGTGELPSVQTTLLEAQEGLRLHIANAVLGRRELTQDGTTCSLSAAIPEGISRGDRVDAWGVILDGWFYADTIAPAAQPEEVPDTGARRLFFGQLHAHTADSDGTGTAEEAFAAAKEAGLDFFAVTDHSNSLDNDEGGLISTDGSAFSAEWAAGKAAAAAASGERFVALYGYEMTWGEDLAIGHINTFNTPGWQSRNQEGFRTLADYCQALSTVPGSISQFNHPCPEYGDFGRFKKYDAAMDKVMQLLEVGSEYGMTAYDYYTRALDAGWHLAPTNSEATHDGTFASTDVRTVILAQELTEASLYEAMALLRVYATEDCDLEILYTMNGYPMGSVFPESETLTLELTLFDPTDESIGTVEVITTGGTVILTEAIAEPEAALTLSVPTGYPYYYLRITQDDGDIAVTAPVWTDTLDQLGIEALTADLSQPEMGQEVTLKLDLFNNETEDFLLSSLVFSQNGTEIAAMDNPGSVAALGSRSFTLPYLCEEAGQISITAQVTGTIAGLSRSYEKTLTIFGQPGDVAVTAISDTRAGLLGEPYRIQGYVTAGSSNPYNTFPETVYVQDDTGGIAVVDFTDTGIQVGTPISVTGILRRLDGNIVLGLTDYEFLDEAYYRYVPRTMTHEVAMDYAAHGGELLQVEGKVVSLSKTDDGKGISRFTLQDIRGGLATVVIEDSIGSGAYGTNELASQVKKNRTVRAIGLLHIDEYGKTVLRVRNCEEVVYIPAAKDPSNPKTGGFPSLWK